MRKLFLLILLFCLVGCDDAPWPAEQYTPTKRPECIGLYERQVGFQYYQSGSKPSAPYSGFFTCDKAKGYREIRACGNSGLYQSGQ